MTFRNVLQRLSNVEGLLHAWQANTHSVCWVCHVSSPKFKMERHLGNAYSCTDQDACKANRKLRAESAKNTLTNTGPRLVIH